MIKMMKIMKAMRMIMRRMRMMHRGGTATRRRCRTTMRGSSELLRKTKPLSDPPGADVTFSKVCFVLTFQYLH